MNFLQSHHIYAKDNNLPEIVRCSSSSSHSTANSMDTNKSSESPD